MCSRAPDESSHSPDSLGVLKKSARFGNPFLYVEHIISSSQVFFAIFEVTLSIWSRSWGVWLVSHASLPLLAFVAFA